MGWKYADRSATNLEKNILNITLEWTPYDQGTDNVSSYIRCFHIDRITQDIPFWITFLDYRESQWSRFLYWKSTHLVMKSFALSHQSYLIIDLTDHFRENIQIRLVL